MDKVLISLSIVCVVAAVAITLHRRPEPLPKEVKAVVGAAKKDPHWKERALNQLTTKPTEEGSLVLTYSTHNKLYIYSGSTLVGVLEGNSELKKE